MIYNEKEKTEQIPGSQDSGETAAVISEQGGIRRSEKRGKCRKLCKCCINRSNS